MATVGTNGESIEHALAAAEDHDEVVAIVGRHPHEAAGFDDLRARGDRARRGRTRASARSARPGSTTTATTRRARTSGARSRRSSSSRRALGLPVVIHTRAAEDDTFAILREHAGRLPVVILHCFSAPDRLEECVERGYLCSFAGNVTYPKATDLQEAARRGAGRAAAGGDRLAVPGAAAGARQAERAGQRRRTPRGSWPSCAACAYEELERTVERNAARVFGW